MVSVKDQADAQRIEDEGRIEGISLEVNDRVFEPPHIP
jgi:hypothetical protein